MRPLLPSPAALCLGVAASAALVGCSGRRDDAPPAGAPSQGVPGGTATPAAADAAPLRLQDVTADSGVTAVYRNGREAGENSILESLGGGVAVWDYDRDGVPDLFFPGGGSIGPAKQISGLPSSLWRGRGGFRFTRTEAPAGVADSRFYTHGAAAGDFDNDGFGDLLLTGYGGLQLFRNEGDGTFSEIARPAGLDDSRWSSSAAWGDFDGDGNPDLYVAHYVDWSWDNHPRCPSSDSSGFDVCGPREFSGLDDALYLSRGDGTFRDATREAGLVSGGKGLGVATADFDMDGKTDVYVANDTTANFLYLNEGRGAFREAGLISGTAVDDKGVPNGSMGIAVFDFDLDLRPDLWVTNFENETFSLYRNDGQANFVSVSESAGVTVLGGLYVGFGTVAADLDLDGDEDIVVTNGHVMYHGKTRPGPQEAIVLANDGRGRFARAEFGRDSYFSRPRWGRGLALGDLDGDGSADLVFSNVNEPAAIVANRTPRAGRPFVTRLVGARSNRDGIGARLILETAAGRRYFRTATGGGSYLSTNENAQFWAIPQGDRVRQLTVYWPSGTVQKIEGDRLPDKATLVEPTAFGETPPAVTAEAD